MEEENIENQPKGNADVAQEAADAGPRNAEESLLSPALRDAVSADQASLIQQRAALLADAFVRVKAAQGQMEADLEQTTNDIAARDVLWRRGLRGPSEDDFRQRELSAQQQMVTSVAILRTRGAQLAGRWADEVALGTRESHDDDGAYIDAAIRCYPEWANAKKSVEPRGRFRQALIRAYNAEDPRKDRDMLWCPIAQAYLPSALFTAAHIVPASVGERTAQALFGEEGEHIGNPQNGLLVCREYEKLLDSAKAVLLPASTDPEETELVLHLLTSDIGRGGAVWGVDALQGRKLVFQSDFRPRKRYLYFRFAMGILRRRRAEVPGDECDLSKLPSPGRILWASPGPCKKQALLYRLSRLLGCLLVEEANRFWDVPSGPAPLAAADEDLAATLASMSCSAIVAEDVEKANKEDEDEGENSEEDQDDEDE